MAERRMFSKTIVESARFLKMPVSSQNLYFHLGLNADDDGVVEAYAVINLVKANEDDLRVLLGKGFVQILNDDLVTYIVDWRMHNKIRADRKKDSAYKDLLIKVVPEASLLQKKRRSDLANKSGPSTDGPWTAQCSVGKDSVGKESIGVCVRDAHTHSVKYQMGKEQITDTEYSELVQKYPKSVVDQVIERIRTKPYHGCLNVTTISSWCEERGDSHRPPAKTQQRSIHSDQLRILANERTDHYG